MLEGISVRTPITATDVRSFFEDSLADAMHHQQVAASEATVQYVARMLSYFSRTDRLVEKTPDGKRMPVLAMLYAKAQSSDDSHERNETMQRLGDVALFLSGIFADSFTRKLIDVDYCIGMGASAYGYLSDHRQRSCDAIVFSELATNFARFVDVLNEVCEHSGGRAERDLVRLYGVWMRTQSPRAAAQLRDLGINISQGSPDAPLH